MCAASRLLAPFALLVLSARRYSAALNWPLLVALFGTADMLKGIVPVADPCAPSHGQSTGVTTIKSRRHLGYLVLEDLEMARWKWFDHDRRIQFEALLRAGHSKQEIAQLLGCHISTVYRELRNGDCLQRNHDLREYHVYSAYAADDRSRKRRRNCGAPLKAAVDTELLSYISLHIKKERRSPAWVAASLRGSDLGYLCEDTIYRYLRRGLLDARPSDLPEHGIRKHPWKNNVQKKPPRHGTSIELRPRIISDRSTVGHWEMDSVIGKIKGQGESIIVMTERMTRLELIFKVPRKDSASVVAVLDHLQRRSDFRRIFKSITMDNGSEFSDSHRLEHSSVGRRRTYCYYCHPFTSCERGSNENANRMIRRWLKKGHSLAAVTQADCTALSRWMNTYYRASLGWKTPAEAFKDACAAEGIKISPYLSQFLS